MAGDQNLMPRASRPLPPRPLPDRPLPARALPERREPAALPGRGGPRPTAKRPDPRPMRVVYGAGAVAAVSIMAVGLVQPSWDSSADPNATDGSWQPTDDPNAVAALPSGRGNNLGGSKVRHVTQYVYLKPGQTAPPGATVITASPPPRSINHPPNPGPSPTPRPNSGGGGNAGGGPVTTPRPTPRPTQPPQATPQPTPRPTPKTRQSGHP